MVNVAINGFGRIGRMMLRIGLNDSKIKWVAINDLGDLTTMAHLFKYDSIHGKFDGDVKTKDGNLIVNGKTIKYLSEKDPTKLPWKDLKVDIVIESTGVFTTRDKCMVHIQAGAKKVLLSAPAKGDSPEFQTCVRGVNDKLMIGKDMVSNASCTTNSLAPVMDVLEKKFGVEYGFMTTIHSYTNDQKVLDLPHTDLRRARAAALNIIPTSTGAAKAIGQVIPTLDKKMDGCAIRVPTPCASITDVTVLVKKDTTPEEINKAMKEAANGYLKGILEYSEEELVSSDIVDNPASSIFDSKLTKVLGGRLVKVFTWYDNEWGFSVRMIEMCKMMAK
jgi:glyceraldehyde 3-phosphate dehydrogenase